MGFTFRAARAAARGKVNFTGFLPAISKDALKRMSGELRAGGCMPYRQHHAELARQINPVVRGWMQYYGAFYRSALYPLLQRINAYLVRWLRRKYRRLRPFKKAKPAGYASPVSTEVVRPLGVDDAHSGDQDDRAG